MDLHIGITDNRPIDINIRETVMLQVVCGMLS